MWIKRALVIVPIVLIAFLVQSVFWVPSTESAADNKGRQNRIVFYMGGDPRDMNPWSSNTTTDSRIYEFLYEGLLRYNKDFVIEPWLSEYAAIHHELAAPVAPGMTLEQFRDHLKHKYGDNLAACEQTAAGADTPVYLDINTGDTASGPSDNTVAFRKPATLRVMLKARTLNGEITSAVDPDFCKDLYGQAMEKFLEPQGSVTRESVTAEVARKLAKAAGLPTVQHSPVVEMRVRPGTYWTDGPFFSDSNQTWQVMLGDDVAGTVVAPSAAEAEAQVRGRHKAAQDVKVQAKPYEKRFGDEKSGPWWGRGVEVTARDPKITYDYIRHPDFGSPRLSSWSDIKDVRLDAKDPYRLEVVYGKLYSPALSNLVGPLLPYHVWNKTAWKEEAIRKQRGPNDLGINDPKDYNVMRALSVQERDFRHKPPSIGPMVLYPLNGDSRPLWKSAEIATLRRNEFYHGRKPEFQFLDFLIFDPSLGRETSEIAFLSGNMDVYEARDFQVDRYTKMEDQYYVLQRQTTIYEYLGFNCRKGPLANAKVRLALSMAIDVSQIMKYVVYEQGQRISGPAYPVLPWYSTEYRREHKWRTGPNKGKTEMLEFLPFSVEEAQAILKEEKYTLDSSGTLVKDGQPFRLRLVNGAAGGGSRKDIALLARENWQKMGVRVEYEEYEWNVFISQYVQPGNFDVVVLGWSGGLNFDKRQLFHSSYTPPRGLNFGGFSSKKADALMDRVLEVYDPEEQVKLSHQAYAAIADECAYCFLYSPYSTAVMDRRIVLRKEVGTAADGSLKLEDRPVNHERITKAKQPLLFFVPELTRLETAPTFIEEDRKR